MDVKITVTTKTTADDFKALTFFNTFLKKRFTMIFLIIGAVFSLAAIIARLGGVLPVANWYFYVCIAFLGLILLQYFIFVFSVKRFLASDQLVTENERTVTVDESGVTAEGGRENGSGAYKWDMFFNAYESKKYYYLYINTIQAVVLPKRDFREKELPVISRLIKEKLGRRYHKR